MIFVTKAIPVNEPGEPRLTRSDVWEGLVRKANNALPFVPAISDCEVTDRYDDGSFDRDVRVRGDDFRERVTLEQPHRVVFTRLAGPVLGTIANEVEGENEDLRLRFSFALVVMGAPGGSEAERTFADTMTGDYLQGVVGTLTALRRIAKGEAADIGA